VLNQLGGSQATPPAVAKATAAAAPRNSDHSCAPSSSSSTSCSAYCAAISSFNCAVGRSASRDNPRINKLGSYFNRRERVRYIIKERYFEV